MYLEASAALEEAEDSASDVPSLRVGVLDEDSGADSDVFDRSGRFVEVDLVPVLRRLSL